MYYYASKLNEASCSGCSVKVPPASEPATSSTDLVPLTADPTLLHGSGLSYYDNDDYYSMVRGNKLMSESTCKHMVMNGGLGFISAQKVEPGQNQGNGGVSVSMGVGVGVGVSVGVGEEVEYRDGQLMSASLEALVDMLRPGAPPSYTFTFLLCSRLFLKPHELLAKLCKRYFKNYDKPETTRTGPA
ncbi:Ras-GEF domain-containing family member 1B-B [Papilio xuthus]|uniref:Ras-GEF domain-containing family member 1B-B n=1 Tax=Papilio xuthus TaxID=66420 RepID=A0A194PY56_PAPXU|nr:Ras-GEF domain-containing family member 1B-B [Papilio xuthus]